MDATLSPTRLVRLALLTFLLSLLTFCGEPPPAEEQINRQFKQAKLAIENLDPAKLEAILAKEVTIRGENKKFHRDEIKKIMAIYRLRKQKISLTITPVTVKMDNYNTQLATAETTVLITARSGLLPKDGRLYKVTTNWRLYGNEWLLTELYWE